MKNICTIFGPHYLRCDDSYDWLTRERDAGYPALKGVDAIVTDPPYDLENVSVEIDMGGEAPRRSRTDTVGNLWGYNLDWVDLLPPFEHYLIFASYKMLGDLISKLQKISRIMTVFTWRKSNAPLMVRPVPRLDTEFIVWAKSRTASTGSMGEFDSSVIDLPSLQAGCFATERILLPGTGKAAHPCQKPVKLLLPFMRRLPVAGILDPFAGVGTGGVASMQANAETKFIGIERDRRYYELSRVRLLQSHGEGTLFPPDAEQRSVSLFDEAINGD